MSFSVMMLIGEILSIVIMGFWATSLRKKNKARFIRLNLHNAKNLKEKDIHLYAINNKLRLDENDPALMAEAQKEMLKTLGIDLEAMQLEANRVKLEQEAYDNDPNISEEERLDRKRARLEERERKLEDRERRSRTENNDTSSNSSSESDSSSGDGGGFDGGGAGASW